MPTSRAAVTDVDIKPFLKTDGPGVAHVAAAMARFPNLARMHAHGIVVDVAAVRGLGPAPDDDDDDDDNLMAWRNLTRRLTSCSRCAAASAAGASRQAGCCSLCARRATARPTCPMRAFSENRTLASIEVPAGLSSIGQCAFYGCWRLASVELPAGLASIGNGAFPANCTRKRKHGE